MDTNNQNSLNHNKELELLEKKIHQITDILSEQDNTKDLYSGLLTGKLGISLALFYLSKTKNSQKLYDSAFALLEDSLQDFKLIHEELAHSFSNGIAGLGYTVAHLINNDFIEIDESSILPEIDSMLFKAMDKMLLEREFDFLDRAGGIALYFLQRREENKAQLMLHNFVENLYNNSNITHKQSKFYLRTEENKQNLTIAHGLSSLIIILSKIYNCNINKNKAKLLVETICSYIISLKQKDKIGGNQFPSTTYADDRPPYYSSRLAWCSGDLGIGLALHYASKTLNNTFLAHEAINILTATTSRKVLADNLVEDAGFCHGTAGLAYMYNHIFRHTERACFKDAAQYWIRKTIDMAAHHDGLAGFKTKYASNGGGWKNDYSLITGISGIVLALSSFVYNFKPKWDEIFLLS